MAAMMWARVGPCRKGMTPEEDAAHTLPRREENKASGP